MVIPAVKEVENYYRRNPHLLGYRERKVLQGFTCIIIKDRYNTGLYRFKSEFGSFEFAWTVPHYPRGTVLG